MRKFILNSLIIISGTFFIISIVEAHSSGCPNDWTSGKDCPLAPYTGQYTFIEQSGTGYYYTDSINLKWTRSDSDHIKKSGHRYTQDNTDGNKHFSATGNYGTNFPNPKYDRDS